jgi:hypothetical protein
MAQMNSQLIEQLMSAMSQGQGQGQGQGPPPPPGPAGKIAGSPMRGTQYAQDIAGRAAPGAVRTISNTAPIPGPGMTFSRDYAGRRGGFAGGGLDAGQDLQLRQNGWVDIGNVRYVLDRNTGQVTQTPRPGSGYGWKGGATYEDYGSQPPISLMDMVGGPGQPPRR